MNLKKALLFYVILSKRIIRKWFFWLILCIMPVVTVGLYVNGQKDTGGITAGICYEGIPDEQTEGILGQLTAEQGIIRFDRYATAEELEEAVAANAITCGFVLPDDLPDRMREPSGRLRIRILKNSADLAAQVASEMVYAAVYQETSKYMYMRYADSLFAEHGVDVSGEELLAVFEQYRQGKAAFRFTYENGEANEMLNDAEDSLSSYTSMPIRGIIAVLIMISTMTAILQSYREYDRGILNFAPAGYHPLLEMIYYLVPTVPMAVSGYLCLFFIEGFAGARKEIPLMICYVLLVVGFGSLIRHIIPSEISFAPAIPLFAIGSLVCCEVFIDLSSYWKGIVILRRFFVVSYYLAALHDEAGVPKLLLAAVILCGAGVLISAWKNRRNRLRAAG